MDLDKNWQRGWGRAEKEWCKSGEIALRAFEKGSTN